MTERWIGRQRAQRAGALDDLALWYAYPPSSRHDDAADDSAERVKLAWAYAVGLLRDRALAARLSSDVIRLHDHKGELSVLCVRPLPRDLRRALCRAWAEMGAEAAENVVFEWPGSPTWTATWEARRFGHGEPAGDADPAGP